MATREGNDFRIEDFILEQTEGPSEIAKFYEGSKVFVTGGTGFMGSVLLDKLLRSCPGVDKVYMLIRGKKGLSLEERYKQQFQGPVFEPLRSKRPDYPLHLIPIEGDCMLPGLGMSEEDRQKVLDTNIVFHVAATVRFDEKIRTATAINVQATIDMLKLAREMKDLKAFVHVSTAYSYPQQKVIDERFYEPDVTYDRLINIVNNMDDAMLDAITPQLITSWPNTYAFTKAVGENAIKSLGGGLPIAMVRPSIVISTAKEPIAGWINNVYGPTGVVAGAGLGLLHVLHADSSKRADMVPADMVINNMLAVAWRTGQPRAALENSEKVSRDDAEIPVYNFVSSVDAPITWGEFMALSSRGVEHPSMKCVWYYDFRLTKHRYAYLFYITLMHLLPAFLVDFGCRLLGKKPFLLEAYKKIHKFSAVIGYFCLQEWRFRTDNVHKLFDSMAPADQKTFDFNCRKLQWDQYLRTYMRGLRVYLVDDPLDTLEMAKKRYMKLAVAHYSLKWSIWVLLFWVVIQILKSIF